MMCAWNELISILPLWMRKEVDIRGKDCLTELRLRLGSPPELISGGHSQWLCRAISAEDLSFCINAACRYSPWTAGSESEGYITVPGGHRMGICGEAVIKNGVLSGFQKISSLCIRVARDYCGIWKPKELHLGSFLILGAPGWGKTTLLRDCTRYLAETTCVCVIDERRELFPNGFQRGRRMDVLSGCPKPAGIEIALKTMRPDYIALDEITAAGDCSALIRAVGCGVMLAATAHAPSVEEFCRRPIYKPILDYRLFDTIIQLHKDLSYSVERMGACH